MSTKLKAGTATSGAVIDADTAGILELQSGSTPTTAITIDASQNVGIGTASPTGKATINYNANSAYNTGLSVYNASSGSSATVSFQLTNDAANRAGAYLTSSTCAFYGGANTFNLGTVESIPFTFLTGNTERMRIDTSGNLILNYGQSTTVGFTIYGQNTAGSNPIINLIAPGSNSGYIQYQRSGNQLQVVNQSGGVYLGATATSWTALSDERFKDIIEPISDALNKVDALRSVVGKYKTDEEGKRRSFLIAQDVQDVFPEAVDATNPEQLGLAYSDVIPLLVAAIKELKAEVDALKGAK